MLPLFTNLLSSGFVVWKWFLIPIPKSQFLTAVLLLQYTDPKGSSNTGTVRNVKKHQRRKHLIVILSSSNLHTVFLEVDGTDSQSKGYGFWGLQKFLPKMYE